MMIFYFSLVCFTFSISYSVLPFHLVCFPISPSLFCLMFSQAFIKHSRKAFVYIYVNSMYNIYFRKYMHFCLTKNFMTFLFHLFDLI